MVEITAKGRKSRTAGRFGVRYGTKNRKLVADIEEKMHAEYACSKCGAKKIKRTGTGIWQCTKCLHTFAGGAFVPQTSAQLTVIRAVQGERFDESVKKELRTLDSSKFDESVKKELRTLDSSRIEVAKPAQV